MILMMMVIMIDTIIINDDGYIILFNYIKHIFPKYACVDKYWDQNKSFNK